MKLHFAPLFALSLLAGAGTGTAAESPPPGPSPFIRENYLAIAGEAEAELRGNILPFWLKNARDREHGGFHAFIGQDMKVRDNLPFLPHGALLTSRILWTFSAAYRRYPDPAYLEMARYAYRDLLDNFQDKQSGGIFWSIGADHKPVDGHKLIYGQAFGIYSLAEYFRATGDREALEQAISIYRLIESRAHDGVHGGYFDLLTRDWQRETDPKANLLGEAAKSQNSHIHILEAFTNLLRVWPDAGLRERQRQLIELTLTRIIDVRTHHLVLFMKEDWAPIGDDISYGHDIELSWLLVEAAEVLGDPALLARARAEALAIAKVTNAEGVDRDGGVYNEGNPRGLTNTHKEWWEQAEATIGFLNAFQISGDAQYFNHSWRSWAFIQAHFVDRQHGDWYDTLLRDCTPIVEFTDPRHPGVSFPAAKLSVWKCPYHNSRCCLELIERLHALAGGPEKTN